METDSVLAIVGLALAIIELYIPKLSSSIEKFMNTLVEPLLNSAKEVKKTPAKLQSLLNKITLKTLPVLLLIGLPSLIILFYIEEESTLSIVLSVVTFITAIPLLLSLGYLFFGGYLVYIFTALAFLIASPAWLIKMMNILGNGRGVSGIGLALACYGVLSLVPWQ